MSRESKRRTKEWLAKSPDRVLSQDVIAKQSVAGLSGVTDHVWMSEGSSAISYAGKTGRLDSVVFTVSPPLSSGILRCNLNVGGVSVASGELYSWGRTYDFRSTLDTDIAVASGTRIEASYEVRTAIGDDGQVGRQATARCLITYTE